MIAFLNRQGVDNLPISINARLGSCRTEAVIPRDREPGNGVADRIDVADSSNDPEYIPCIVLVMKPWFAMDASDAGDSSSEFIDLCGRNRPCFLKRYALILEFAVVIVVWNFRHSGVPPVLLIVVPQAP